MGFSTISFLYQAGLSPGPLLAAEREALRLGVEADEVLLAGGAMEEDAFYSHLARHFGVPFIDRPVALVREADWELALSGRAAIMERPVEGATFLIAPRGMALRALLSVMGRAPSARANFALTTPRRFGALLRQGHGIALARNASLGLLQRQPAMSARHAERQGLGFVAAMLGFGALVLAASFHVFTAALAMLVLSTIFLVTVLARLVASLAACGGEDMSAPALEDRDLPVYSLIVPLHDEADVLRQLIDALGALNYPAAKLDIKIMVERHDARTIAALAAMKLPARYEVIVAPSGLPRTKPRALNIGLALLRGELVTIYDAEDRPDPGQLRQAAAVFAQAPQDFACLQARLSIDNTRDSWLAALFTIEYAALFDVVNPGFARLDLPIPLGGTSNHFRVSALREAGAWDAWNVTEDADLGIRLARRGYRVGALDSITLEEAPAMLGSWLGQRRRWLKGWMQTLIVHGRNPLVLIEELGAFRALVATATVAGGVIAALFGPLFAALLLRDAILGRLLAPADLIGALGNGLALMVLATGLLALFGPAVLAIRRQKLRGLLLVLALLPAYYLLVSYAAWRALFDLAFDPHGWIKTAHGLARTSRSAERI